MKRLVASAAALLIVSPVVAADLAGGAIPDLEERIAELEATTARKGNRKVSLTISGQINKAMLWHDIDGLNGDGRGRVIDNANSPSVLRVDGSAKVSPSFSAGFIYEFGIDSSRGKGLGSDMDDIYLRHAAVWVGTPAGKISLGQTSTATDGIAEITTANTAVASRMLTLDPLWTYAGSPSAAMLGYNASLNPLAMDGDRLELVRYDSPTFMGFTLSASYAPAASMTNEDVWDVALRYAGDMGDFRIAGGVGYRHGKQGDLAAFNNAFQPFASLDLFDGEMRTATGSASVMHMPTGLFVNAAVGHQEGNPIFGDVFSWQVQAGAERNVFGFGATTIFAEYGQQDFERSASISFGGDTLSGQLEGGGSFYGAGIVQRIDGLAVDLYLHYRRYDLDGIDGSAKWNGSTFAAGELVGGSDAQVIMGGMRIKF